MMTASVAAAANAPANELRQFMVTPTTRTIVNASTNSTAEARNAAAMTAHCINCLSPVSLNRSHSAEPGRRVSHGFIIPHRNFLSRCRGQIYRASTPAQKIDALVEDCYDRTSESIV